MDAKEIITYHVHRARSFNHNAIRYKRLRKEPLIKFAKHYRATHMAMAREVKKLVNMAEAYERL